MAKKETKKAGDVKPPKEELPPEKETRAPAVGEHDEDANGPKASESVRVEKKGDEIESIKPQGRFVVVEVAPGRFRMFGLEGQPVSPTYGVDDINPDSGKKQLWHLSKNASRFNAIGRHRKKIVSPEGAQGFIE